MPGRRRIPNDRGAYDAVLAARQQGGRVVRAVRDRRFEQARFTLQKGRVRVLGAWANATTGTGSTLALCTPLKVAVQRARRVRASSSANAAADSAAHSTNTAW
ncbi:hypothetical protein Deima_0754 [Deinococcus maricopensis DSM 21211]|uniref:Uncharacterized protein n=1 Tax=Deinococcus maricopensis (strain DSM 21211 / LMG 22137 / NRRL B-23946 / LB-34) TaxID=709986 RepID=E8U5S1_DEIML|nr:hypothetical protein Deima_0754 [Deinococcus maricopensis DSM 21211]